MEFNFETSIILDEFMIFLRVEVCGELYKVKRTKCYSDLVCSLPHQVELKASSGGIWYCADKERDYVEAVIRAIEHYLTQVRKIDAYDRFRGRAA